MRSRFAACVALLLVVGACGGGNTSSTTVTAATTTTVAATTTTAAPGFEVTSEDGNLSVFVPVAAAATDPGITIRQLDGAEYPPELAGAADDPNVRIYNLEPEGLVFDAPVTVTRRIDTERFEDLAPNEVPVMLLVTRDAEGRYELYSDLTVLRDGADIFVSGTTTHFSPVVAIRESPTATVTLDREQIENVASARSLDGVLTLLTEAPGTIPVTATLRGRDGSSLTGMGSFVLVGGVPAMPTATGLDIECAAVETIEVLPITYEAVFGSSPAAGAAGLTAVTDLITRVDPTKIRLGLAARVSCLDPATSLLGLPVRGFKLATDHPGGMVWIPGQDFRGGASGAFIQMGDVSRLEGVWGGLICDNDRNGRVDATDTMFPPYPIDEVGEMYSYVAPLFDYGSYFVYLVDAPQYSAMPSATSWNVSAGLTEFKKTYTGMGRFEASIGYVGVGGVPSGYEVGPSEEEQNVGDVSVYLFEDLRIQF